MSPRQKKRKLAPSVRRKISRSLKAYYQEQKQIAETRARQRERERARARWRAAERARAEAARSRQASARKGWATRRAHEREAEEKEARRLAKWRKSYRDYLTFGIPKKAREELKKPEKRELVCKVLYDGDVLHDEHIWVNFRELMGDSIGNVLARIPAESGVVNATFRLIEGEEFTEMQAGDYEPDVEGYGTLHDLQWETELTLEEFWASYYENARTLLPEVYRGDKTNYSRAALYVLFMEVCYRPGQILPD